MKKLRITYLLLTLTAVCIAFANAMAAGKTSLSDKDKQFLASYEKAHLALTADNLDGAKAAASELGSDGAELSKSSSLKDARVAFEKTQRQSQAPYCRPKRILRRALPDVEEGLGANINNGD